MDTGVFSVTEDAAMRECVTDGMVCRESVVPLDDRISWTFAVDNAKGDQTGLMTVGLELPLSLQGEFKYYNGDALYKTPAGRVFLDEVYQVFPLTMLYAGGSGLAVGLDPRCAVSHFSSELIPGEEGPTVRFAVRLAVPAGKQDRVTLILNALPATYGYLNAYQWLYDAFPSLFAAPKGIDPRFFKGSSSPPKWNGIGSKRSQIRYVRR